MDELTLHCDLTADETVLTITGPLEAHRCGLLREALDLAARPGKPVVVDLAGVTRLGVVAQVCLAQSIEQARRNHRATRLRNLPAHADAVLPVSRAACRRPSATRPGSGAEPNPLMMSQAARTISWTAIGTMRTA